MAAIFTIFQVWILQGMLLYCDMLCISAEMPSYCSSLVCCCAPSMTYRGYGECKEMGGGMIYAWLEDKEEHTMFNTIRLNHICLMTENGEGMSLISMLIRQMDSRGIGRGLLSLSPVDRTITRSNRMYMLRRVHCGWNCRLASPGMIGWLWE